MARLLVTHTAHFARGADGRVYTNNTLLARPFWSRYLTVFENVCVAARVGRTDRAEMGAARADGDGVEFLDLPDFTGPWQYLKHRKELQSRLGAAAGECDVFCLRVPCAIASLLWRELRKAERPFGLEVVGDPWDSLAPGGVRSLARPLARRGLARDLRAQCRQACAAWYVTARTLQRSYPPAPGAYHVGFSDVELPPEALAAAPRTAPVLGGRLIFVGTLAVLYKAQDVLIQAIAKIGRPQLHLTFVGEGRVQPVLEKLAASLGVGPQVEFAGQLPAGEAIRAALDGADLFVLPSRTEGLPRAMIEAMARGLPCIGSNVGGIPELLPPDDLVPPGDAAALADKIVEILDVPDRYARASRRNLEFASQFLSTVLERRRTEFYEELHRRSNAGSH